MYSNVTVEIVEQPESKSTRFRYLCEGRTAGSISGVNSTRDIKTFPSIRVLNYDGAAVVIVSCVTHDDSPYKPHPNCLIGKLCKRGVCKFDFTTKAAAPTIIKFPNLGIQCVKKTDVAKNLEEREVLRIDPFKAGFKHKLTPKCINLHKVRLCFQVLLTPDVTNPKHVIPVKPVVSEVIIDKQQTNMQLLIHDISDYTSPPSGGKKIMIFCDKVDKKDIRIRFYEAGADDGTVVWEDWAQFKSNNVHKQVAISFQTPAYKTQNIDRPVPVLFRLETMSDRTISNAIPFQYVPDVSNIESTINSKKRKIDDSGPLYEFLQTYDTTDNRPKPTMTNNIGPNAACAENVVPVTSNLIPSNFFASNNNLLPQQQQRYDSLPVQSHYEQSFQQHSTRQQPQQTDYQWPSSQQLPNIQAQQMHHHHQFGNGQCQQSHYLQQQYQPTAAASYGNYLSPYTAADYQSNFSASNNLSSNNIGNCSRTPQSTTTYQNPIVDTCPIPMNYEGGPSSAHHSGQQMGHVYAADKVIIQFCHNNFTINQPQNVTDKQNMGESLNAEITLL